jgi:hypothetical protein
LTRWRVSSDASLASMVERSNKKGDASPTP